MAKVALFELTMNNLKRPKLKAMGETNFSGAVNTKEKATEFFNGEPFCMNHAPMEKVAVVGLDTALKPVGAFTLSIGGSDTSLVPTRELAISLLLMNAAKFIIVHNHPSGEIEPSGLDREVTLKLLQMGALIGIPIVDHVIIGAKKGSRSYSYSFKEHGLL